MRAGGKHNDLENVGYTARHHTFFEMLGNFSFGDYFKRDAIRFAWELLTKVYGLPPDKLWVTVYDDRRRGLRHLDEGHRRADGAHACASATSQGGRSTQSDNFWQMADTGPCGPCIEIFYDHGPGIAGGPPGSPDADGDRYIEIWNLVFMQFNRDDDGHAAPAAQALASTPAWASSASRRCCSTCTRNYEIDLFQDLIKAAARETGAKDLEPALRCT